MTQLPIAIAAFRDETQSPQKISAIVQADLERSGQFRGIDTGGVRLDEAARPDVALWRQKGADSLVSGSVVRLADGRYYLAMEFFPGGDLARHKGELFAPERALQIVFATGTEVLLNSFPSASLAPGGSSGDKVTTPTSFKVRGPLTFYAS